MTDTRTRRLALLAGAVVVVASACATPAAPVGSALAHPVAARSAGRPSAARTATDPGPAVVRAVHVPGTDPVSGLVLVAPDRPAPVSLAEVLAHCGSPGLSCLDRHPDGVLARASSPNGPATINPDGSTTPELNRTLVWILSWYGVGCVPSLPIPAPGTTTRPVPENGVCTVRVVVDADSGRRLYEAWTSHLGA